MLNPSKADEKRGDNTVDRQIVRAKQLGFGGLYVTNAHALVSTDPRGLLQVADPIGADNDLIVRETALLSAMVLCGWGNNATKERHRQMVALLNGIPLYCLRLSKKGRPEHPLYIGYDVQPQLWRPRTEGEISPSA